MLDVEADAGFWMSVDAEESTQADWISIANRNQHGQGDVGQARHGGLRFVLLGEAHAGLLSVLVKTGSERAAELTRLAAKRSRTALVSGGLERRGRATQPTAAATATRCSPAPF